jgi:muramoyltetrapeptide carboxypeptidase
LGSLNPLKAGDHVALIAPARAVSKAEMSAFKTWCTEKQLILHEGRHLYGRHHQFSGTAAERAADLREAWQNPDIKAVFCARGGYGCVQLLDLLEDIDWKSQPKWLIGFSDITTLHLHLNKLGIPTLHGPMAIHWGIEHKFTDENIQRVEDALFRLTVEINNANSTSDHQISFKGRLLGGNLSLVYASLGTPEQPDTENTVLFLEDLDEYLYHIDRMMVALKRAGLLKNLSGLIVGGMTDMKDNTTPFGQTAEEIIQAHMAGHDIPVVFDFPAGHTPKNACLFMGADCTFENGKLTQQL